MFTVRVKPGRFAVQALISPSLPAELCAGDVLPPFAVQILAENMEIVRSGHVEVLFKSPQQEIQQFSGNFNPSSLSFDVEPSVCEYLFLSLFFVFATLSRCCGSHVWRSRICKSRASGRLRSCLRTENCGLRAHRSRCTPAMHMSSSL